MKIREVEFIISVASLEQLPKDGCSEVAFAGRSNVGKSSLINCLLNRKKLARISSSPGKTRQLNYYKINNEFYFVDLPGYGFAKVAKSERVQWRSLIEAFIETSPRLKGVVLIIDSRIGPTQLDLQLIDWLSSISKPTVVIATKCDKLSKSAVKQRLSKYSGSLSAYNLKTILPFSSATGMGKKELLLAIFDLMRR